MAKDKNPDWVRVKTYTNRNGQKGVTVSMSPTAAEKFAAGDKTIKAEIVKGIKREGIGQAPKKTKKSEPEDEE